MSGSSLFDKQDDDYTYFINKLCIFDGEEAVTSVLAIISVVEIFILCYMLFRAHLKRKKMVCPSDD
jgi:hypothetical protein